MISPPVAGDPKHPQETWTLRIKDRPAVLERLLSMLRRRRIGLETLGMKRGIAGHLDVEIRLTIERRCRQRILAELEGMADVDRESVKTLTTQMNSTCRNGEPE